MENWECRTHVPVYRPAPDSKKNINLVCDELIDKWTDTTRVGLEQLTFDALCLHLSCALEDKEYQEKSLYEVVDRVCSDVAATINAKDPPCRRTQQGSCRPAQVQFRGAHGTPSFLQEHARAHGSTSRAPRARARRTTRKKGGDTRTRVSWLSSKWSPPITTTSVTVQLPAK